MKCSDAINWEKVISPDLSGNNGDGLNFYEQVIAGEALDAK